MRQVAEAGMMIHKWKGLVKKRETADKKTQKLKKPQWMGKVV